jgi:hypothetical protein
MPPQARTEFYASLRALVLAIGGLETLALVMFAALMLQSSDPLGAAIGRRIVLLLAAPYLVLTLPGLVLAWRNRLLPLALALVALAVPATLMLWHGA